MKSSAIVIGSHGQVAGALRAALSARGVAFVCTSSTGSPMLDLGSEASIRSFFAASGTGKEVFLPGAMTHVDKCEDERERCERVNAVGPRLVAEECARRGHALTYFSTEYVFGDAEYSGGAVGPFTEEDPPAPPCWYGACKLEGERGVLRAMPEALVLRTTMVFSWAPEGQNFLMQYFRQLEALREGRLPPVFRIPEDQISTPTYAPALADACLRLREKNLGGIYNVVGADLLSRRELVLRVIDALGFERETSLAGFRFLKTKELGQRARRPLTAGLRTEKLQRAGISPLSLASAFREIARLRA
jgi:dTDP-4-dehydrorhamnose reductase